MSDCPKCGKDGGHHRSDDCSIPDIDSSYAVDQIIEPQHDGESNSDYIVRVVNGAADRLIAQASEVAALRAERDAERAANIKWRKLYVNSERERDRMKPVIDAAVAVQEQYEQDEANGVHPARRYELQRTQIARAEAVGAYREANGGEASDEVRRIAGRHPISTDCLFSMHEGCRNGDCACGCHDEVRRGE